MNNCLRLISGSKPLFVNPTDGQETLAGAADLFRYIDSNFEHWNCNTVGPANPDEVRPPTGREIWRRWQFVYTGNDRVPFWIVRVPKEIIWGHGGLWSDNSVAMLVALFRMHF